MSKPWSCNCNRYKNLMEALRTNVTLENLKGQLDIYARSGTQTAQAIAGLCAVFMPHTF